MYEFKAKLKRSGSLNGKGLLFNEWIWVGGNYYFSIQCSKFHYCYPRKNLKPWEYEEYEVLIIKRNPEGNEYLESTENREINMLLKKYGCAGLMKNMPARDVEKLYKAALKEWGGENENNESFKR